MPRRLLLAASATTALTVLGGSLLVGVRGQPEPTTRDVRREVAAAAILRTWDAQRAAAWSAGDVGALGAIYTAGSPAGRADRRMLREWLDRGLRVEGLRMQLLRVRVQAWTEQRLIVTVTDRLAGGTAVGEGVRAALPRDRPTSRTIVLRSDGAGWRVASVSAHPRAVRTTS